MDDKNAPHRALGKRTQPHAKSGLSALLDRLDLADRRQVAMLALVLATVSVIASDIYIRLTFGTVKVRTGWIGDWDQAITMDHGWVWVAVLATWLIVLGRCMTLSHTART